jgi:NAD(P)-dependent dehydrogenase (short-subunit alcohol dehydrogenase family)
MIITGVSCDIGAATAKRLAAQEAAIVVAARDEQALDTVAGQVTQERSEALAEVRASVMVNARSATILACRSSKGDTLPRRESAVVVGSASSPGDAFDRSRASRSRARRPGGHLSRHATCSVGRDPRRHRHPLRRGQITVLRDAHGRQRRPSSAGVLTDSSSLAWRWWRRPARTGPRREDAGYEATLGGAGAHARPCGHGAKRDRPTGQPDAHRHAEALGCSSGRLRRM